MQYARMSYNLFFQVIFAVRLTVTCTGVAGSQAVGDVSICSKVILLKYIVHVALSTNILFPSLKLHVALSTNILFLSLKLALTPLLATLI